MTLTAHTREGQPTPRALGYRMPAEWARHTATWLAWPHNANDWPGRFQPIAWVYADIVRHLSRAEEVHVLVNNQDAEKRARRMLCRVHANLDQVRFHHWPTNRIWMRDSGPIFVTRPENGVRPYGPKRLAPVAITNWKFNAWAKYDDWQFDNELPARVADLLDVPVFSPTIRLADGQEHTVVLEGGSIDTNGAGVLLTTEECLLSDVQQRNPGVSREQLEHVFREYLGIDQVLWLNRGIAGDDTHGHVDDISRFVDVNTIVTAVEPNTADENHLPLSENLDRLRSARNRDGQPFRVLELPLPSPVIFENQRLPASYANFYVANGVVLVPTFNDANDRHALNILADAFPQSSHCRHPLRRLHLGTRRPALHDATAARTGPPMTDEDAMRAALLEAEGAASAGEVPVGAVVLAEGIVVGAGQNRVLRDTDPTAHAEVVALRAAALALGNYRLTGCTLVSTLEPCAMCAGAIMHARIARLVFAAADLKAGAAGSVLAVLNHPELNHTLAVHAGLFAEESAALLRNFFRERRATHQQDPPAEAAR